MTTHVFIGVGPANLHRALKIKKIDPTAKLVFIDERLKPDTRDIDREKARANIFRFENDEVTAKLLADGVKKADLDPLIYQREFSVPQGFQSGDDTVFTNKPFTQIQIRDLQLLLMKTIDDVSDDANKPVLLKRKVGVHPSTSLEQEVAEILYEDGVQHGIGAEDLENLKIHVATGALTGDAEKNEIVYPDKAHHYLPEASDDIVSMPVTPLHGTTTFIITDQIELDDLKKNQRSLDLTPWRPALKEFGWNLVRPPRIRVFYANDILYIGAEIPVNMAGMDKEAFEEQVTAYTRKIASLVFPDLNINGLPVNPHLRSRFPTARGERGDVISTKPQQDIEWGGFTFKANVTTLIHGDSRYLPHYQTGSGFVTAFLQNELYADIYSRNSFEELVQWAVQNEKLPDTSNALTLRKQYEKLTDGDPQLALEAFQKELFMAFSRDIIEHNKEKVGRYFNAIHNQALDALGSKLGDLLKTYTSHQWINLNTAQFEGLNPRLVTMELLKVDNIGFLREVLPQLLNKDFSNTSDQDIIHIRNMHLLDFEKNLKMNVAEKVTSEEIVKAMIKVNAEANQKFNQYNDKNPFHNKLKSLLEEKETTTLITKLQQISQSLDNNPILHHRSLLSIFTGKHSHTISQFAKDIDKLTTKYADKPEELKSEALSTILKFHDTLEKGSSRRTIKELEKVTDIVVNQSHQTNLAEPG